MTLPEAAALINCSQLSALQPQTWFDLGCGNGLFSHALRGLLHKGGLIYAIDKESTLSSSNQIKFLQLDFLNDPLPEVLVDGVLMANALHYVRDKIQFLAKIKRHFLPNGVFLLVEYDMQRPNYWVPFPVSFSSAQVLFKQAGFEAVYKISERPSTLNNSKIYAALFSELSF
jgi:ubiquinone/menaquinone biosynthesis C-methylase UbiE